eukprot:403342983
MTVAITLLYWKFFYSHGTMHINDIETYVHPVFLYIVPALFLVIEYALNQIIFDYKKIVHLMILYVIYLPFTYIGKLSLGYFPYYFINWSTWYSYAVLIALAIMQIICFFILAFISNYFKRKYLMKNLEQQTLYTLDRGGRSQADYEVQLNDMHAHITAGNHHRQARENNISNHKL